MVKLSDIIDSQWIMSTFFLLLSLITLVRSTANFRAREKEILDSIIGDGRYDRRIRPSGVNTTDGKDGPAIVRVNIYVRSISRIDDVAMEYALQITFREQWKDDRLQYHDLDGKIRFLTLTDPDRIWKPDLFFSNEKSGHFHNIIMPNVLLRIYPNGEILYSIRISLVLFCPMDLRFFPLDKQDCEIKMASYGYTTEDLVFQWKRDDPVQVVKNLHLPRFGLSNYVTEYCTSRTNTGEYSCIVVRLTFKREFSYYLIQIYFPCVMLVIVSWVSFWLDPNAIPARVSLGVTTLLTMATQISGINASLPPVSYIKAIDVWTESCLTFVFGALLEFALVNYASRSDAHRAAQRRAAAPPPPSQPPIRRKSLDIEQIPFDPESYENEPLAFPKKPLVRGVDNLAEKLRVCEIHSGPPNRNPISRWLARFPSRSKQIDVLSRICFPVCFLCFNLVYWTRYLNAEDQAES
ncbi:glutamate-gated chloride channel isoform X1 [Tetranychus urticae]|nr:glutamate-gated chloride channel isoform X1 [Tetranychus urticae]